MWGKGSQGGRGLRCKQTSAPLGSHYAKHHDEATKGWCKANAMRVHYDLFTALTSQLRANLQSLLITVSLPLVMDPSEVEFLAEKEEVSIVPNFSQDTIHLILGDIGPFNPGLQVKVPLWMAINLKQQQKCRIMPPDWMDVEKLERKKTEEQDSQYFTEMPSRFYKETTQLLLQHASDNIPKADEIRTLVKDIWDLRMAKLRSSIDVFVKSDASHARLNHLTLMELNTVRPFLTQGLQQLHVLRNNVSRGAALTESQD